jgi:23S rRNA (uracil1939-C5)-methyltransferase
MRITIEKLIHGGNGMGRAEGKAVFVPFSAPGDELEVEIVAAHPGFLEARIVSVVTPAACRVQPRCPVFGTCGGCQWQHLSYEEQLIWKRAILVETLERTGGVRAPCVLPTLPSPKQWHYRNRMMLHVDSKGRVGYYRAKSKEVVEFAECFIADESLSREMNDRREELRRRDRGIALRTTGEASFSQVNAAQNENMRTLLAEWLGEVPHARVCELYAGSGNLTEGIARLAGHVVASEIDVRAVQLASERFAGLHLNNVEFTCMPSEKAVKKFAGSCDAVVVDPPRKGCREAIEAIAKAGPSSIIYISCDPSTLARDVRFLAEQGYALRKSKPIDMFPQTFHIESMSLLCKG